MKLFHLTGSSHNRERLGIQGADPDEIVLFEGTVLCRCAFCQFYKEEKGGAFCSKGQNEIEIKNPNSTCTHPIPEYASFGGRELY